MEWPAGNSDFCVEDSQGGTGEIYRVPAEGGAAVKVTSSGGFGAQESRDGRWLYFTRRDRPGLWKMPVPGGQETQVHDWVYWADWRLTAGGVYFMNIRQAAESKPDPRFSFEFFDFTTGKTRLIGWMPREPIEGPALAVSPDGKWLLFTQQDSRSSDIVLVENFR